MLIRYPSGDTYFEEVFPNVNDGIDLMAHKLISCDFQQSESASLKVSKYFFLFFKAGGIIWKSFIL